MNTGTPFPAGRLAAKAFAICAIIAIGLFSPILAQLPDLVWAKGYLGLQYGTATPMCILEDSHGSVITMGQFRNTVDFDPGPGVYNLIPPFGTNEHIYIQKLDSMGAFLWAGQLRGT